jgi:hypothetical protein
MTRLRRVAFGLPTHHPIFGPDPHISSLLRRRSSGCSSCSSVPLACVVLVTRRALGLRCRPARPVHMKSFSSTLAARALPGLHLRERALKSEAMPRI